MESTQVYSAPKSNVTPDATDDRLPLEELKFFSFDGRLNRMRYFAYSVGFTIIVFFAAAILGIVAAIPVIGPIIMVIGLIAIFVASFVFSLACGVRRLHDMDMSGWLWLLLLVPLVNFIWALMMMFMPGTNKTNNFGVRPPENTSGVKTTFWLSIVAMFVMPMIIGILAAIAIPAYQDYTERAQAAQYEQDTMFQD